MEDKEEEQWRLELNKFALRYHLMGAWVAVIFNVLFFVTDYINTPEHWLSFLYIRCIVSFIILITILLKKRINISVEILIFIPAILISIQNAYMWSLMDAEHLQAHTLAYIALFIGIGMLVLWKIRYSIALVIISFIANVFFFLTFSDLSIEEIMSRGGLLTLTVAIFSILLIQTRFRLTKSEIKARINLKKSNSELKEQRKVVSKKNEHIIQSIEYAKTIQDAILPNKAFIKEYLPNSFILFKPRDIVSGDFYWFGHYNGKTIIAAVDCTGHGVPGAFMSMIGNTLMNKVILDLKNTDPAKILGELKRSTIEALDQSGKGKNDSMDMAICVIDHENKKLEYAGAYNPLYFFKSGELQIFKADKMPIGLHVKESLDFTNHVVSYQEGDSFYIFSDGYVDQFGGSEGKKYTPRRLKPFLSSINHLSMSEQKELMDKEITKWMGNEKQIDDILFIGVQL